MSLVGAETNRAAGKEATGPGLLHSRDGALNISLVEGVEPEFREGLAERTALHPEDCATMIGGMIRGMGGGRNRLQAGSAHQGEPSALVAGLGAAAHGELDQEGRPLAGLRRDGDRPAVLADDLA